MIIFEVIVYSFFLFLSLTDSRRKKKNVVLGRNAQRRHLSAIPNYYMVRACLNVAMILQYAAQKPMRNAGNATRFLQIVSVAIPLQDFITHL